MPQYVARLLDSRFLEDRSNSISQRLKSLVADRFAFFVVALQPRHQRWFDFEAPFLEGVSLGNIGGNVDITRIKIDMLLVHTERF